jgi:hypothetical protein
MVCVISAQERAEKLELTIFSPMMAEPLRSVVIVGMCSCADFNNLMKRNGGFDTWVD